jgi:hypothetical protein
MPPNGLCSVFCSVGTAYQNSYQDSTDTALTLASYSELLNDYCYGFWNHLMEQGYPYDHEQLFTTLHEVQTSYQRFDQNMSSSEGDSLARVKLFSMSITMFMVIHEVSCRFSRGIGAASDAQAESKGLITARSAPAAASTSKQNSKEGGIKRQKSFLNTDVAYKGIFGRFMTEVNKDHANKAVGLPTVTTAGKQYVEDVRNGLAVQLSIAPFKKIFGKLNRGAEREGFISGLGFNDEADFNEFLS